MIENQQPGTCAGWGAQPLNLSLSLREFITRFPRRLKRKYAKVAGEEILVAGVAGRYATALFELARDEDQLEIAATALIQLNTLLNESDELRQFIRNPIFSAEQQTRVMTVLNEQAEFPPLIQNFLQLLVRNRRIFTLSGVIAAFQTLVTASRDELNAEVISAVPLAEAQTQELKATLKAKTGKDITLNEKVDPAILGGLVVKIGSRMVDNSVRTKLNNLKNVMKEVG
jgi:F-type H+-transporting ATPase subunit delta